MYVALPSVLATARLTDDDNVSLSLALAAAPVATSTTSAVLTSGSAVMPGAKATGADNVITFAPPAGTRAFVSAKDAPPVTPLTEPQLAAPLALHVTLPLKLTPGGSTSVSETSRASVGPALPMTSVYAAPPP